MAERQYSVSFPRHRIRIGPKPIDNRSTPTPVQRATKKWPSSWTRIRMPMTTTKGQMKARTLVTRCGLHDERFLDELCVLGEPHPPVEERGHRHLVRGVEHDWRRAAGLERRPRQSEARELVDVG